MDNKIADQETKEFVVNDYITLKLENGKTETYIGGEKFLQCKKVAIDVPIGERVRETASEIKRKLHNINSIDDLEKVGLIDFSDYNPKRKHISEELEFFVHCSNLQAWVENKYDTRSLHSNIAFPMLKRLVEIGDPLAKKRFKEEIMKRYLGGRESLACYFQEEGYLNELSKIELQQIAIDSILNCNRYAIEYLVWSIDDRDSLRKPEGLTIIKRLSENEILNLLDNILFFVEKRDDVKIKSFANEWVQKLVMEVIKRHFSGNLGTVRYWHERDLKLPSYISLDTDVNEIKNLFINDGPIVGLAISKYEGNPINDFTEIFGLAYLKDLKSLELHGFECPEITGLESQKELEKLNLDNNNIRDIKKLKKMTCLKELHLSCNHIKDIKGLTNLKQLESLWLVFNEIVELDGIETLISLKKLNLTKNSIENIDKIKTLTKLREIRLSGNKIRDFSPLDGLKELKATPSLK